jgi:transposase
MQMLYTSKQEDTMPTKTDGRELVKRRQKWFEKKNMSVRDFAKSMDLDYNTCIRWASEPRVPQRLLRERVEKKWPDFPVK